MAGQTVLITGGAGGIGSALARQLVGRGDKVVLFGRRPEPLEQLAEELGPNALAVAGDSGKVEDLDRVIAQTVAQYGRLDGLAHCVGSIRLKPLHLTSEEEFAETIHVNLFTAFFASRAALAPMRKQGSGSIVLVSTVAVRQGLTNHEAIAAAKGGVEGMVRAAAITYARMGIRFNAVAPALIDTPLAEHLVKNEASRAVSEALHPLGRIGTPEDVAATIAFLLGPESSWITGQVWGVDGGMGAGHAPPRPVKIA